jgi:hypothetical protein
VKDLAATAAEQTPAPRSEVYALLSDFEGYPRWAPGTVPTAEVLERDDEGEPSRIKTTLRGALGPIGGDFKVHMAVALQPQTRVELRRLPKSSDDREEIAVIWRLSEIDSGTEVELALQARLSIPRFVPVVDVPQRFAREFLGSAISALRSA